MDFDVKLLPPGDPKLIDSIVNLMKCQGIFDELRRESLADVDTTPAYQNLRHRVEGFVEDYLKDTRWRSDLNKNQLRDAVRRNINDSEMLTTGVNRIVDQVVTPKIHQVFLPKVTEIVHKFLGIEKNVAVDDKPKEEPDQQLESIDVDGLNVVLKDSLKNFSSESQAYPTTSLVSDRSSVKSLLTEKIDTTTDKESAVKKVMKEPKEEAMKTVEAESRGSTVNKKQEQKSDLKAKTTPSDKSKLKLDSSQKKVVSSSSIKTKPTDVKVTKSTKVTEKSKSVSKPKDTDSNPLGKGGSAKSISSDGKDGKSGKVTVTKAKLVDDKTKSIVKTKTDSEKKTELEKTKTDLEKTKTDSEKTKTDVSKTEKQAKEQGKSKFSNSSRFRSLGSNSKKDKPKEDKGSKSTSNVVKTKSVTLITKSVDTKIKTTEPILEKKLNAEPSLQSKNADKPKLERTLSGSHKRTSSESKSNKTENDSSSLKTSKTTKCNPNQKEEQTSQTELLKKGLSKEKVESDEKLKQETVTEIQKKQVWDGLVRSLPNETGSGNDDDKLIETKEVDVSQNTVDAAESSPVANDSESQSSLETESPKKMKKQKRSKRDEDRGRDGQMSDDELSDITVSSVHTSDLSDFDDNITLTESDDDEDKKVELKKRNAEIIVDRWDVECIIEYLLQTVEEMATESMTDLQIVIDEVSEYSETKNDSEQKKIPELKETLEDKEEISVSKTHEIESKLEPDFEPEKCEQNSEIKIEEEKEEVSETVKRKRTKPKTSSQDVLQKKPRRETLELELERESERDRSEIEPRRELRRQRKLNPRYASDDFSSIFSRGSREQNLFYEVPGRGDLVEVQAPIRGRRLTGHSNTTDETDCALSPVSDFSEFGEAGKTRKLSVGSRGKLCSPSEGSECSDYSRSHEASTPDQSEAPGLRPQTSSVSVAERKTKRECSQSPVEPPLLSPKVEGRSTRRQSKSEMTHDSPPSTRQRTQRADRQRYDSTDLYKPRSAFTSSSRRLRGMSSSSSSSSAARDEPIDQQDLAVQSTGRVRGRPARRSADAPSSPRGNKRAAPTPSSNYSIKRRCRV